MMELGLILPILVSKDMDICDNNSKMRPKNLDSPKDVSIRALLKNDKRPELGKRKAGGSSKKNSFNIDTATFESFWSLDDDQRRPEPKKPRPDPSPSSKDTFKHFVFESEKNILYGFISKPLSRRSHFPRPDPAWRKSWWRSGQQTKY